MHSCRYAYGIPSRCLHDGMLDALRPCQWPWHVIMPSTMDFVFLYKYLIKFNTGKCLVLLTQEYIKSHSGTREYEFILKDWTCFLLLLMHGLS